MPEAEFFVWQAVGATIQVYQFPAIYPYKFSNIHRTKHRTSVQYLLRPASQMFIPIEFTLDNSLSHRHLRADFSHEKATHKEPIDVLSRPKTFWYHNLFTKVSECGAKQLSVS